MNALRILNPLTLLRAIAQLHGGPEKSQTLTENGLPRLHIRLKARRGISLAIPEVRTRADRPEISPCQSDLRYPGWRVHFSYCSGEIMKTITLFVVLTLMASFAQAQSLTASQAKAHEGENATVCGKVASERTATSSRGEPTFINLDAAYPNQIFTILVWGDDRQKVGALPGEGSRVCATGVIQDYRGVPEIVVRSSGQLSH
jgi:hypothetical protein